jgi:hypothetical protein
MKASLDIVRQLALLINPLSSEIGLFLFAQPRRSPLFAATVYGMRAH